MGAGRVDVAGWEESEEALRDPEEGRRAPAVLRWAAVS